MSNSPMISDEHLDFLLVGQKDRIIYLIDNARTQEDIRIVIQILLTLSPMWSACNYSYKTLELTDRLQKRNKTIRDKTSKAIEEVSATTKLQIEKS